MFDLFRSREKAMKYLLTAVLSVVALSMVITLVPGITNPTNIDANDQSLAHVCNAQVTQGDIRTQVDNLTRGQKLPPQMVSSYLPIIIDTTIENLGLSCVALEKGLDVSDQDLADEIRNAMPNLMNAKGEFDKRSYEMGVQRMGYTVPMFEERMKQQILLKRMQDLSTEGVIVPPAEVQKEYERRNIKIKIQYATMTSASLAGTIHPSDDELQAYFKTSPGNKYTRPAKREYTVVYADQDKIGSTLTIADDKLRAEYNRQIDRYRLPERSKVRHILILTQGLNDADKKKALDKIQGLQKRAKGGEDFGKLAKEFSEDPGSKDKGGVYDFTPHNGTWVKPFEDAAFNQPVGEVGPVVTTEFGYHVIEVMAREQARVKPFEEVKGVLANEVQSAQVQDAMQKAVDSARAEMIKNPSQIEQIAEKYHLDVVKTGGKLQANQPMPVLGMATELINAAFAVKLNEFTTVTKPQAGKLAFAKVDAIEDSRPATFDEVRPQVVAALTNMKAEQAAQAKVKEASAKLSAGEDFKSVAKFLGTDAKTSAELGRDSAIEGVGDANAVADLFTKPVGSVVGPISVMGQFLVAKSIDRVEPSADQFATMRPAIVEAMKKKMANERYMLFKDSVMQHLLAKGKIKRNQKAIEALITAYLRNG